MSESLLPPEDMREIDARFWAQIESERQYRKQFERQQEVEGRVE